MFRKNSLRTAVAVAVCAFTFSLVSHAEVSVGSKSARPLITQKIDENSLVTLKGNTRWEARRPDFDRGAVDDSMPMEHMLLQLKRSPEQQKALDTLVEQLHTPGNPMFHKWLTPQEFGQTFGLAPKDLEAIKGWLESHGFTVNVVYTNGSLIDFSGNAGDVKEAFHTEIHNVVDIKGAKHIANMSDPKIPTALSNAVAGVMSLTNFFPHKMISKESVLVGPPNGKRYKIPIDTFNAHKAEIMSYVHQASNSNGGVHADDTFTCPADICGEAITFYGEVPADFNKIYNTASLYTASTPITGAGQTVVTIEDENMTASDDTTFRAAFLPSTYTGTLTQVHPAPPSGTNNCTNPGGDSDESALDVEWAGAVAPNAAIELSSCSDSTTTFGGLLAIQNMVNTANTPSIFSVSYGECEAETGTTMLAGFLAAYQQAAAQGQSVFVSSGDSDGAVCDGNGATVSTLGISVNGWGSTPYNVSVGGTDFGDTYAGTNSTYWNQTTSTSSNYYESALSYINEIPWNDSCASKLIYTIEGYASGEAFCNSADGANFLTTGGGSGGPSAVFSKPSFQSGLFGNPSDGVRDMPDIALMAANGVWNQDIIFCFASGDPDYPCTYTSGTDTIENSAGGTSFASPSMAGIQALINQATGEAQGDPNYILYALAKTAYGAGGSSTCNSTLGNAISSSCVYHDVTQGDNDTDCDTGTPDCYTATPTDTYGVLSTSTTALDVAFLATSGWDFTTGIGTPNAANLVAAWKAYSYSAPTVAVTTSPASLLAGAVDTWTAVVTGNGSYPTGTVAFSVSGTSGTIATITLPVVPQNGSTTCTTTCSATASYAYTVPGGTAAGTYTVTAAYGAPNEQYTTASGTGTYNVVPDGTTSALSASPNPIAYGAGATVFTDVISLSAAGGAPTGSITFSSSLTQVGTIATVQASSCTYNASAKTDTCTYSWTPTYGGVQTITAAYTGDTTYASSSATTSLNVTENSTSSTLTINPATVTDVAIGTTFTSVTTYTGSTAPTGTVTIGGGLFIATVNVSSCTTNTSAKTITCTQAEPQAWNIYENGTYAETAMYSGDAGDASSTSSAVTFIVAGSDADTNAIAVAPATSVYATGGTTTATLTLTGHNADGNPTGTITVTGNNGLGTLTTLTLPTAANSQCTLSRAKFVCTVTLIIPAGSAAGADTLTSSYSGDVNYLPSTGTATYTITVATPTLALTPSPVTSAFGSVTGITLTATSTGVANGTTPGGVVTFTKAAGALGTLSGTTCTLASGTCSVTYTPSATQAVGTITNAFTGSEAANGNYGASNTADDNLTTTAAVAPTDSLSAVSAPFGSTTGVTITATSNAVGSVVTFGTAGGVGGSFSPTTCTISGTTCSVSYIPSGTLAVGTYASDLTASFGAADGYSSGSATSTLTITSASSSAEITFTSVSHNFGQVAVGTAAVAYGLTATNTGTVAYTFAVNFTPAKGFTSANNCPASLAAGAKCQIDFYFTPTATGAVSTTWSVTTAATTFSPSNGGTLQGSGTSQGGVSLTTNGHNFGTVATGTASPVYGTELSNSTTTAESVVLGPVPAGPFTMVTNCGTTLAAGSSCEIEFTFTPTSTSTVSVVVPLSGTPTTIMAGGAVLPSGGITLSGN